MLRLRLNPCRPVEQKEHSERATDLAGDAQRAAAHLWNEHGLDAVARAQPTAATCACRRLPTDSLITAGGSITAIWASFSRSGLAMSVIRAEVRLAALVNPAQELPGAERLLADLGAEAGQAAQVVV